MLTNKGGFTMTDFQKLTEAVGNLDEDTMIELLEQLMEENPSDASAALAACQKGMDIVGELFETKEYFISDLIFAGDLMSEAVEILKPELAKDASSGAGKMLLCTVEGDLHDIGKNIVRSMLEAGGFEVIDLGIDTPAEKIVETVKEQDIHIVGLSGVLTLAIEGMKKTIDALHSEGLDVKVIVGGSPVNEAVCAYVGADAWAFNPQDTVNICTEWANA